MQDKPDPEREAGEPDLRELIVRISRGDEHALGLLYDAAVGRIYGLALRITRNPSEAEEVAEDVFFQVWRQALRFDPARGTAMAWLLAIARSRALDSLRRRDTAELCEDPEEMIVDHGSTEDDPQDLVSATQRGGRLHAALAELDALPRQLLALAYFRGLTHEEIAEAAILPLGTVKTNIRRALQALRNTLSGELEGGR